MTQFAQVNGQRITDGSIVIPYYGACVGDLMVPQSQTMAAALTIAIGPLAIKATAFRQDSYAGTRRIRFVGGAGGWRKIVASRHYTLASGVPAAQAINDAAIDAGETIGAVGVLPALGPFYTREEASASQVLRMCGGPLWYVDLTGKTQVAIPRVGTIINSAFTVQDYDPAVGKVTIATEALADWQPGRTFKAPTLPGILTISMVRLHVDGSGSLRLEVMVTP